MLKLIVNLMFLLVGYLVMGPFITSATETAGLAGLSFALIASLPMFLGAYKLRGIIADAV